MIDQEITLSSHHFFHFDISCHYIDPKQKSALHKSITHKLPYLGSLWGQAHFSSVYMGWSEEGVYFSFDVHTKSITCTYPDIEKGDAVEIFLSTRESKNLSFMNRFCHHFFFLPEAVDGKNAGEKTKFRGDETRPLVKPEVLKCATLNTKKGYMLNIEIPHEALFGFEAEKNRTIALHYVVHTSDGREQKFSTSDEYSKVDMLPKMWATCSLK